MKKFNWKTIAAIAGLITTVIGAGYALSGVAVNLDSRYAKASELKKVQKKVEWIGLNQLYLEALQEYYTQKKLINEFPDNEELKDLFDKAKRVKEEIESQLSALKKK